MNLITLLFTNAVFGTPFLARESESWFPLLPSIGASWAW